MSGEGVKFFLLRLVWAEVDVEGWRNERQRDGPRRALYILSITHPGAVTAFEF